MSSSEWRSAHRYRTNRRKQRFAKRWLTVLAIVGACGAGGFIYEVFFHIYDVGPKQVIVNGQAVEQIDGLSVHSKTWLSKQGVQTLLSRIQAADPPQFAKTKMVHGTEYVPANDLVSALTKEGDANQIGHHQIAITLRANEHYYYQEENGDIVRQQTIRVNGGHTGHVLAVSHDEATYVPVQAMANILSSGGLSSSWTGSRLNLALTSPAVPEPIENPDTSTVIGFGAGHALYAPTYAWHGVTYVPIDSLNAALSQLGWTSSSSAFVMNLNSSSSAKKGTGTGTGRSTSPAANTEPKVMAFVPFYSDYMGPFDDVARHGTIFQGVALDTWTVNDSGDLLGSAPAGTALEASKDGDSVTAMVTNLGNDGFDAKEMTSILTDKSRISHLQNELVSRVLSEGYDGVTLDFEAIPPSDRAGYSSFVTSLASTLHNHGKDLNVVVPADTSDNGEPWNQAYDLAKIGRSADTVIVMAYDYSYPGGPAGPIAPLPWVQQTLSYTVSRVSSKKVVLGIDAYGYDWAGKHTTAVGLPTVDSFVASHHIQVNWDKTAEAPWYTWTDAQGVNHTVYYEDGKSTTAKLKLAQAYGIRGVALWRAGLEDNAILNALSSYVKAK